MCIIYKTAEIASIVGIHPNTVRLYEKLGLLPPIPRQANGYRIFTERHLEQIRLIRLGLQVEILQSGLRKKMFQMLKKAAWGDFPAALGLIQEYLEQIQQERKQAEEAIQMVQQILAGKAPVLVVAWKRKEVSEYLGISLDTLRNWEMNGLLTIKRRQNGYRVYQGEDLRRLKIIRSLRKANYSLAAILQMLQALEQNPQVDLPQALNTPSPEAEITSVCDKLLISLAEAEKNAHLIKIKLEKPSTIPPDF